MKRMNAIDQCRECGGRLTVLGLDRQERMRRRVGQALIVKCARCGSESVAVKKAWFEFVGNNRRAAKLAKDQRDQRDQLQPSQASLF
jgi:hypothetical protein